MVGGYGKVNLYLIEQKVAEIVRLRKERRKIQDKINSLVNDVMGVMKANDVKYLKAGSYAIEVSSMIRRDFDFKRLDELQEKGVLDKEIMRKSFFDRLLVSTSDDLELIGNKFVRK